MPHNKKHHFVPRFYLKRFSVDGKSINLYNLKSAKKITRAKLKNQGYRDYFYGKTLTIEHAISVTEAEIAKLFRLIDQHRSLPPFCSPGHFTLIVHLLMQHGRTTYSADTTNEMFDKLTKQVWGEDLRKKGFDPSRFTIGIKGAASYSLGMSVSLYPILVDLRCKLLLNRTNEEFVTSDNPVVLYNQLLSFRTFGSNCGLASKGLQIFLPLDPEKLLVLYDDATYRVGSDSKELIGIPNARDVYELNALQTCSASENIYFRDSGFDAQALHRKALPYIRSRKVNVAASVPQPTAEGSSQLVASSIVDIRTNLSVSVITLKKSARRWRDDFRRLKTQPAVVIRNEGLRRAFDEFDAACQRKEYKPSEFARFIFDRETTAGAAEVSALSSFVVAPVRARR
jgi:Protein of unknown function (DUF4238)